MREKRPGEDPGVDRDSGPDEGLRVETAIEALDWPALERDLDAFGSAVAPRLLPPETCRRVTAMYAESERFRSTIVMARHGFGRGEYRYFADPLAGNHPRVAQRPVSEARAGRRKVERGDGPRRALSRRARCLSRAMPRSGANPADAAPSSLWPGRLQLPAPGRLRAPRLSAPGRDPAQRAGPRLHRRRIRADRAAAAHAVAGRGGSI